MGVLFAVWCIGFRALASGHCASITKATSVTCLWWSPRLGNRWDRVPNFLSQRRSVRRRGATALATLKSTASNW